jgi:hypothetical protein
MKEFGKPFEKYEPIAVANLSFPNNPQYFANMREFGAKISDTDELMELKPEANYRLYYEKSMKEGSLVLPIGKLSIGAKEKLDQIMVGVAPAANVYQIPPNQKDLSVLIKNTLAYYDYYLVEFGLNICLKHGVNIPDVNFEVDLYNDLEDERSRVTAYSVAPADTIKEVTIISGQVGINISKLLELIPSPLSKPIADALDLKINPIKFSWKLKRYEIDTSGPKNYNVMWRIYNTDNVQSFNPLMIIKVKKGVKKIFAKARIFYALKTGHFKPVSVRSDEKEISIFPFA